MIVAILTVLGLVFGSFVNALTWRLHEQTELDNSPRKTRGGATIPKLGRKDLSILQGRSMCPSCHHTLAVSDLLPIVSWLALGGRCRYCKKAISVQYPLVEAATTLVFVGSYVLWPLALASAASWAIFGLWLAMLVVLVALAVYDLKWTLLPDKLVLVLAVLAVAQAALVITSASSAGSSLINHLIAVAIGGGLFYLIFVVSSGRWIGGGDVKIGFVLGLIAGTPSRALLLLFLAALLGTLVSLPLLASKRLKRSSAIPFGPFLILATVLVVIFGSQIIDWYISLFTIGY